LLFVFLPNHVINGAKDSSLPDTWFCRVEEEALRILRVANVNSGTNSKSMKRFCLELRDCEKSSLGRTLSIVLSLVVNLLSRFATNSAISLIDLITGVFVVDRVLVILFK